MRMGQILRPMAAALVVSVWTSIIAVGGGGPSPGGTAPPAPAEQSKPSSIAIGPDQTVTYLAPGGPGSPIPVGAASGFRDDPTLEPGFPITVPHTSGTYHGGPAIHTLVMNLDADAQLEIIATGLATGPIYAWNHDGTAVPGWPVAGSSVGYPAGGPLVVGGNRGLIVGYYTGELELFNGSGLTQAGWPRTTANYVATPPSLGFLNLDTEPQIFVEEEDWNLHGYRANGDLFPGWPVSGVGGQERHTSAVGDVDGDGQMEIVTCSGATTPGVFLFAYEADGTLLAGFPKNIESQGSGCTDAFPVIGEIDGDASREIVVANKRNQVLVFHSDGNLERTIAYSGTVFYSTAVALADLNGDGKAEVVVQTNDVLNVLSGTGGAYTGWPVSLGSTWWQGNSAPVVGDIDGGGPDIAVTVQLAGSGTAGEVRAYHADGTVVTGFPKALPIGAGAVPAIADIDLDGRNELIVTGSYWDGSPGSYAKCWAFDLHATGYQGILWGQFMHDESHTGYVYATPWVSGVEEPPLPAVGSSGIHIVPSPAWGPVRITLDPPVVGAVGVFDLQGRLVRALPSGPQVVWDGRAEDGTLVRAGLYWVTGQGFTERVLMVR